MGRHHLNTRDGQWDASALLAARQSSAADHESTEVLPPVGDDKQQTDSRDHSSTSP